MFARNCKFQLSAVYGFAEESVPWKDMTVLSNLTGKSRKEGPTHCCGVNGIEIVLQYSAPIELWLYCTSLGYTPVLKSSSVILWQENLRKTYFILFIVHSLIDPRSTPWLTTSMMKQHQQLLSSKLTNLPSKRNLRFPIFSRKCPCQASDHPWWWFESLNTGEIS